MLKLNKIIEDDLQDIINDNPAAISNWSPVLSDPSEPLEEKVDAAFNLTSYYLELGYANYALENLNEVKQYFQQAAPYAFLRGFDPQLKTHNNDWTIQEELNVCLLFGDNEISTKLMNLIPDFKTSSIINQACYLYDHLLLKIGTGVLPSTSLIDAALTEAKNTKDKDVLQYILPLIEAIQALVEGDKTTWQASIDKAITWHTEQCQFGDLKDMEQGFMCLNALTMTKLGQDLHQWTCTTQSLYLPLFLIAKDASVL